MRNTSETDYDVIKYNRECSVLCRPHLFEKNVWVICITLFHSSVSFDG